MVAIICMNSVRVFTVFYHARFANMSEKIAESFPADSTLIMIGD